MCHEYNTNRWHRLKPDINGSYQNGSWDVPGFTVADMPNGNDPTIGCVNCPYQPLYFASAVLPMDEWLSSAANTTIWSSLWTNIGFMYDPVTNTWSAQITVPGTWCCAGGAGTGAIGDAQSTILTNGTMLVATHAGTGHRVVQSRDADLHVHLTRRQGRQQRRGELESPAERDIPDCRFEDSSVIRNLRSRDQLVGDRRDTQVNLADTGAGTEFGGGRPSGPAAGWHAYRLLWHEVRSERGLQHCDRHVGCNWRQRQFPGRPRVEPLRRRRWAGVACCRMATCW